MAVIKLGPTDWSLSVDKDGQRTYDLTWKLVTDSKKDGPHTVFSAPGLPLPGATWTQFCATYGFNDVDSWAFCTPELDVSLVGADGEGGVVWEALQRFSTKPITKCSTQTIQNPLAEPDRVSGSFAKLTKEITKDRNGNPVRTKSFEQIRGASVEFDDNRPTVIIEQNRASLGLAGFAQMVDGVNSVAMWGLGTRRVKLSNASWQRKVYGTCSFYYTRRFEFEIRYDGFDRTIQSEGHKRLDPTITTPTDNDPDTGKAYYLNPKRFVVYKDRNEENTRTFHDEFGRVPEDEADIADIDIEYYNEFNFFTLGIPSSF